MKLAPLGELTRDASIEDWWVSRPTDVPMLGERLRFVVEALDGDGAPEEFAEAVAGFLALRARDRAEATVHVHRTTSARDADASSIPRRPSSLRGCAHLPTGPPTPASLPETKGSRRSPDRVP